MRLLFASFLAVMCAALAGCQTHSICDARGPSDFCEIHHALMRTEVVKNKKAPMPSRQYLMARSQAFIHAYPFMLPEQCKSCAVFICDDCVRAEEEWKRKNGQ